MNASKQKNTDFDLKNLNFGILKKKTCFLSSLSFKDNVILVLFDYINPFRENWINR